MKRIMTGALIAVLTSVGIICLVCDCDGLWFWVTKAIGLLVIRAELPLLEQWEMNR